MKRFAPAARRNCDPIGEVLQRTLPSKGLVLEVASGTGEHAVAFSRRFQQATWQPSDMSDDAIVSIRAWRQEGERSNLLAPITLDVTQRPWPIVHAHAVVCINMVHISPWRATVALMRGSSQILCDDAPLYLYGPYLRNGVSTSDSNRLFDQSLRDRNEEWGIRQLEDVVAVANEFGFVLEETVEMPANNLSVIFRKRGAGTANLSETDHAKERLST